MTMNVWGREEKVARPAWAAASGLAMAGLLLAALLLLSGCGAAAPAVVPSGGAGTLSKTSNGEQVWALQVLELTNLERVEHGVPPLELDEAASFAAYAHSWDMDLRTFFDHVNPDGDGPGDRLLRYNVAFKYAGENIARGQATPEEVVQAWMDSPSHRVNMLSEFWTHIGIGVHTGPDRGPWWAQSFLRK